MAAFVANTPAQRGPVDGLPITLALVPSGVYTATANAEFGAAFGEKMVEIVYTQTAGTAGQSLTVGIDGWNEAAQAWENLITSAAITSATTATVVVQVNPFAAPVTNSSAQRLPRRRMRVVVTHADSKNVTYTIDAHVA